MATRGHFSNRWRSIAALQIEGLLLLLFTALVLFFTYLPTRDAQFDTIEAYTVGGVGMPVNQLIPIKRLKLDLNNYRTVPQKDELSAINAIIAIKPDKFWALTESILDSGYLPTENIIVLKSQGARPKMVVKEGNRRISALKLIHGHIPHDEIPVPQNILERIKATNQEWRNANLNVPCSIYEQEDILTVNKIRDLTHGKAEKAGRDVWSSIARARHNRAENGASEPALDLLEKYFSQGKNITQTQRQRFAGDYKISILDEAIKRLAPRIGSANSTALSNDYPNIKYRTELESIILDIGLEVVGFEDLRKMDGTSFYGIPENNKQDQSNQNNAFRTESTQPKSEPEQAHQQIPDSILKESNPKSPADNSGPIKNLDQATTQNFENENSSSRKNNSKAESDTSKSKKTIALPINDKKQVKRRLNSFSPKGKNREKIASLQREMKFLDLDKNPMAFCFLLRSIFEISAKAYCIDHKSDGLSYTDNNGRDRPLVGVLRDITNHLTDNRKNMEVLRQLHGAMSEIAKNDGILSVTSLNQLVHNPTFSIHANDIAVTFGNIMPLLEALNQ